jgi:acetoin utilization deacetylase AcuC-like enzyme
MQVFFSPSYTAAGHHFDTTRKAGWMADSLSRLPIEGVRLVAPEPMTVVRLEQVHAPTYVNAVRTGEPRELAESNGFPWDAGVWTAVCASTGGAVSAVLEALRTTRNAGSLSSGLHHASTASGNGYCTFNGLALGAREALDAGALRVLILDLDAHCGGGTAAIVRGWQDVVHVDVSVSAFDRYDRDKDGRSSLDVVTSATDYLPTIARRLRALHDLSFDLVIYNAGMDPHQASPGGIPGITFATLAERERLVFAWARDRRLPVAFTLAGGYLSPDLSQDDLVGLHRLTITAAGIANAGHPRKTGPITTSAYAGPHRGAEGFSFDANGRKSDAGFHADMLGAEENDEDDPFAYDSDMFCDLTPENQDRFLHERLQCTGKQDDFLKELLSTQRR